MPRTWRRSGRKQRRVFWSYSNGSGVAESSSSVTITKFFERKTQVVYRYNSDPLWQPSDNSPYSQSSRAEFYRSKLLEDVAKTLGLWNECTGTWSLNRAGMF